MVKSTPNLYFLKEINVQWRSARVPERQLEQNLERQAELDRGIRKDRRAPWASLMRHVPDHLLVQPDQQRPALPERIVVGGPVCRAVAGGLGLAHAARLTAWIPDVNPSSAEFCNNAGMGPAAFRPATPRVGSARCR